MRLSGGWEMGGHRFVFILLFFVVAFLIALEDLDRRFTLF